MGALALRESRKPWHYKNRGSLGIIKSHGSLGIERVTVALALQESREPREKNDKIMEEENED
eukprot:scaffold198811_cov15-Tisochrysis_lutea.AAC.1